MSEIIVHKFGGSCLRDSGDLDRIAEIITSFEGRPIVVVSALWGMTDRLIRAAGDSIYAGKLVRDLKSQHLRFAPGLDQGPFKELFNKVMEGISTELVNLSTDGASAHSRNLILAAGERLSALVVAHRLRELGLDSHPVGAEDIGLKLKGIGSACHIDLERSNETLDRSALVGVPILTGWFGEGEDGKLALLSRGGSDHSAAAFANLMGAEKLVLWKDVDGIKRLNPRWGIETDSVSYLGYGEAAELSKHGTPVIHPATVNPLISDGIPLEIRNINSSTPVAPTMIGPDISDSGFKAIGCQPGVAVITSNNPLNSNLLSRLEEEDITVWSLTSTPDQMRIIIPSHYLHLIDDIVDGEIEFKTAIISIIGTDDFSLPIAHEIVSINEYGMRIIIETDDLTASLESLYHSLFSRQDCK